MAGALAAPLPRGLPALLRIGLRSVSSSSKSWADAGPQKSTASAPGRHQEKHDHRLSSVTDAFNNRKLPPELRGRPNAIRSETDIVNVVEQKICRSMEEGHFENLPGKGKPLNLSMNPHADPAEDTLYKILSRNGCAPQWVELNKEIRCTIAEWRLALKKAWMSRINHPGSKWLEDSEAYKAQMRDINNKILHYNLIVPFGRQMFRLNWEKEINKLE